MITKNAAVDILRAANPVATSEVAVDGRAQDDLRRILASRTARLGSLDVQARAASRPAPYRRLAPIFLVTAVLAAAALIGTDVLRPGGAAPAYATTPDRLVVVATADTVGLTGSPAEMLNQIASRTATLPDDTGTGRYAKTVNESWALWTRVDGDQVTSEVVPQTYTTWVAADGSGRSITTRNRPGIEPESSDTAFGPDEHSLMWPFGSISSDDTTLAGQLEQAHPVANGPAERLVAITDLVREQPLTPAVRAAVLRYLARTPGLAVDGIVTDRAGRRGIAVQVDTGMSGLPERRTLIIDPHDGRILGSETVLTEDAGALNVRIPSVIGYTTFRSADYVNQID